jgi:GntR family phosphonate transport system transcriptional regulator
MTALTHNLSDGMPLYRQIARRLQDEIERELSPGAQIASEHELAQRFLVNRHTVRRAVDVLAELGMLVRRQGLGTYVTEAPIDYSISGRTRFTENLEAAGRRAVNRIVNKCVTAATGAVAEMLEIREGDDVTCLETLRLADDRPLCVATMHVPFAACPEVLTGYTQGSLHAFIEQTCGFSPRRSFSLITAILPAGPDAGLLMMPANQPVLRVKSVNVNPKTGTPVEYSITRFRADRVQLRLDLDESGSFTNPIPHGDMK